MSKTNKMVVNALNHEASYEELHPGFAQAFSFLKNACLQSLTDGRVDIDGDRVFAIVATVQGKGETAALLEAHRNYIDIQVCVSGEDTIGVKDLSACQTIESEYDPETDLVFFKDKPEDWVVLKPNTFAIFYPDHAHAPLAGNGAVKKIVVKVAV